MREGREKALKDRETAMTAEYQNDQEYKVLARETVGEHHYQEHLLLGSRGEKKSFACWLRRREKNHQGWLTLVDRERER